MYRRFHALCIGDYAHVLRVSLANSLPSYVKRNRIHGKCESETQAWIFRPPIDSVLMHVNVELVPK